MLNVERLAEAIETTRDLWFGGDRDTWWLAEPEGMAADIARAYNALPPESGPDSRITALLDVREADLRDVLARRPDLDKRLRAALDPSGDAAERMGRAVG